MTNVNRLNEICSRAGIYSPFLGLVAVSVHPMCPRNGPHTSLYPTYAGVTCSVCTACAWDRLKPRLKWDDGRREPTSARYELIRRQRGLAAMPCATDPTPGGSSPRATFRERTKCSRRFILQSRKPNFLILILFSLLVANIFQIGFI
jgi:hypothetical protein